MNKVGSTGFTYIIALVTLMLLGILIIMFNQAIGEYVIPVGQSMVNDSPYLNATELTEVNDFIDKGSFFWDITPIILFLIIMIYVLVSSLLKNNQ